MGNIGFLVEELVAEVISKKEPQKKLPKLQLFRR